MFNFFESSPGVYTRCTNETVLAECRSIQIWCSWKLLKWKICYNHCVTHLKSKLLDIIPIAIRIESGWFTCMLYVSFPDFPTNNASLFYVYESTKIMFFTESYGAFPWKFKVQHLCFSFHLAFLLTNFRIRLFSAFSLI